MPLPLKTSLRLGRVPAHAATIRSTGRLPTGSRSTFPGEESDPAHVRVWGEHARLDRPDPNRLRAGEELAGETDRLGAYAARLWGPLLELSEQLGGRDNGDLRPPRPAADGHDHGAGGERRHRQDVRARRLWSPATSPRGGALDEMLLITFGRAASQELRERVRDQLVRCAERAFADPAAGAATTSWSR